MTYWYQKSEVHGFCVWNVETRSAVGYVKPQGKDWRVEDGDNVFVTVVGSRDEADCALADYYKKHSKWQYEGGEYFRWTEFGLLQVQYEQGSWFAIRNGEQTLLRDGVGAGFPAPEQAQRAADGHRSDDPGGSTAPDGLSWFMWDAKLDFPTASDLNRG